MNENEEEKDGNDVNEESISAPMVDGGAMLETSICRKNDNDEGKVPLWLITFTDVMALMLTFFVLLYAMSKPAQEEWDQISASLGNHFNQEYARPYKKGAEDAVEIDKIPVSKALSLAYLEALVTRHLESEKIENVVIFRNADRLVISLPSELLFKSGRAEIKLEGKKALFSLAGALQRIRNRLEIIGHTDPDPITSQTAEYKNNWELSLARAGSVASALTEMGYTRDLTVRGMSSGRYDDLPEDIEQKKRYDMARRVDIVLMNDEGYRIGGHTFE